MLIIVIVIIAFGLYATWRYRLYARSLNQFSGVLPRENRLTWPRVGGTRLAAPDIPRHRCHWVLPELPSFASERGHPDSGHFEFKLPDVPILAASADGLLQSLPSFDAFLKIDPDVLKAIQFSSADHIHNLRSMDSYIHDHFFCAARFLRRGVAPSPRGVRRGTEGRRSTRTRRASRRIRSLADPARLGSSSRRPALAGQRRDVGARAGERISRAPSQYRRGHKLGGRRTTPRRSRAWA